MTKSCQNWGRTLPFNLDQTLLFRSLRHVSFKMNKSFYMEVDLGLMFVGVWFIIMDFFATKIGDLRPGLNRKKDSFYGTGNHRFRRGGYVVICIAVVGFIALLLTPAFTQFPSEGFI